MVSMLVFLRDSFNKFNLVLYNNSKSQNKIILETLELKEIPPDLASSFSEIRPLLN
jgi:hypothetical protein